jgi:hypothetical protein
MVDRQALIGKPRHDDPKDVWRAYQPPRRDMAPRRGSSTAIDYEAMATTMDADPLQGDQIVKARNTVASWFATHDCSAAELADTLAMLGIYPGEEAAPLQVGPHELPNPASRTVTQK